ncbi:hypothetical protein [Streptomyces sp. NPDC048242]|uniref:hypothetical protein n=1 Tax=Streptomyces sp. NPDC048242 TaxID=3155026 RepID=UPI0033D34858
MRFAVIGPGAVDTEPFGHQQPHVQESDERFFAGIEKLHPEDIADTVAHVTTSPRRRAINEIVIRPTDQAVRAPFHVARAHVCPGHTAAPYT